jgi:5'-3' exonuclease
MIIIDFNQVMISNLMMQLGNHTNIPIDEGLFRHMVLNSLRSYKQQFGNKFGEIVIACDDKNYWRKQEFPYYKANRKKTRDASEINWTQVFEVFNKIKSELREYFPYRVIQIDTAEADDIIATLTENFEHEERNDEKLLILSGDKDYIQLHKYQYVNQYDPTRKKWITHNDPHKYLYEHILKGDSSDGIPNILSDGDTFVSGKRQKPLTQKRIDELYELNLEGKFDHQYAFAYARNKRLIDLTMIPLHIKEHVLAKYEEEAGKDRSKIFNYFIKYKLKNLMENVGEF